MLYKKLAITLALVLSLSVSSLRAQVSERHGYIGIGIGPSFLVGYDLGNEKAKTGLNITLVNFGYVFAKGFGITSIWAGGAHPFEAKISLETQGGTVSGQFDGTVRYATLMIGPMYSLRLPGNASIDFKVRAGSFYARESLSAGEYDFDTEKNSLGYSFGISYQQNFSLRWCFILSTEYISGEMESISNDRLAALSLNAGVGFTF